jgi:hypothetical protein
LLWRRLLLLRSRLRSCRLLGHRLSGRSGLRLLGPLLAAKHSTCQVIDRAADALSALLATCQPADRLAKATLAALLRLNLALLLRHGLLYRLLWRHLLHRLLWSGLLWSGLLWSGLLWSGLLWSGLLWSGLLWELDWLLCLI